MSQLREEGDDRLHHLNECLNLPSEVSEDLDQDHHMGWGPYDREKSRSLNNYQYYIGICNDMEVPRDGNVDDGASLLECSLSRWSDVLMMLLRILFMSRST